MVRGGQEVFALDIGTRTIAGLFVRKESKNYKIIAHEVIEHESRVMYDGQIHDIEEVAKSVRTIKDKLEKKVNTELKKAAVAAAGRVLYTVEAKAEKKISPYEEVTEDDIRSLEADALSIAVKSIANQGEPTGLQNHYCVGFNPVKWFLQDEL